MAAFFALLAGLAIGVFIGMFFVGCMIAASEVFRKMIIDLCVEAREMDM
jgi:hypothetical protein